MENFNVGSTYDWFSITLSQNGGHPQLLRFNIRDPHLFLVSGHWILGQGFRGYQVTFNLAGALQRAAHLLRSVHQIASSSGAPSHLRGAQEALPETYLSSAAQAASPKTVSFASIAPYYLLIFFIALLLERLYIQEEIDVEVEAVDSKEGRFQRLTQRYCNVPRPQGLPSPHKRRFYREFLLPTRVIDTRNFCEKIAERRNEQPANVFDDFVYSRQLRLLKDAFRVSLILGQIVIWRPIYSIVVGAASQILVPETYLSVFLYYSLPPLIAIGMTQSTVRAIRHTVVLVFDILVPVIIFLIDLIARAIRKFLLLIALLRMANRKGEQEALIDASQ